MPPTIGTNVLGRKVLYLPSFFTYGESASQAGRPTRTKKERQLGSRPSRPRGTRRAAWHPVSDRPAGRRGSKGDQRQPGLRGREQVNKTALIQLRRLRFPDGSRMVPGCWPGSRMLARVIPTAPSCAWKRGPGEFALSSLAPLPVFLPSFFSSRRPLLAASWVLLPSFPCVPEAVGPTLLVPGTEQPALGVALHLRP